MYGIPEGGDLFSDLEHCLTAAWFSSAWTVELPLRLLEAFNGSLPADGAALLFPTDASRLSLQPMCATPGLPARVEDAQQIVGEGPAVRAFDDRHPVLVPRLGATDDRWNMFTGAVVSDHGSAMFAFPLEVGSVRIGVLDLYRTSSEQISLSDLASTQRASTALAQGLLDISEAPGVRDDVGPWLDQQGWYAEMSRATLVVSGQLGVAAEEANVRIRAHAFATDRALGEVIDDILASKLLLER